MSRLSPIHRLLVGVAPLVLITIIRSLAWYRYAMAPMVYDVWYWMFSYLILLPVDGVVSELYGFLSGEKLMAFLIGFLPSIVAIIVASTILGWNSFGVFIYLLLGLGMGIMGFGGAVYKAERKPLWLVAGFLMWLLILLMTVGAGMD